VDPGEVREVPDHEVPGPVLQPQDRHPWADLERRLDVATVLSLCGEAPMPESAKGYCVMGVDTGRDLHAVVLRGDDADWEKHHWSMRGYQDFAELEVLLERFSVVRCVIDGLPETHATREFARKHGSRVSMNFFNEHQRGAAKMGRGGADGADQPHRGPGRFASGRCARGKVSSAPEQIIEEFARHMAANAKILEEDEETGAKKYKYIRTGADHFSLAFHLTPGWQPRLMRGCAHGSWA